MTIISNHTHITQPSSKQTHPNCYHIQIDYPYNFWWLSKLAFTMHLPPKIHHVDSARTFLQTKTVSIELSRLLTLLHFNLKLIQQHLKQEKTPEHLSENFEQCTLSIQWENEKIQTIQIQELNTVQINHTIQLNRLVSF